jgi:outer membrane protein assembly factor BamB
MSVMNIAVRCCHFVGMAALVALDLGAAPAGAAPSNDWLQFGGDPQHSNASTLETTISINNVNQLQQQFAVLLPSIADGAPVYLSNVQTPAGLQDLVFVSTHDGHLIALNAHSGATVWSVQNGPGSCHVNNGSTACYTTSSPAIDPDRQFIYNYGLDGYVHKHAVGTGAWVTTDGWPKLATRKPFDEKGSADLTIASVGSGRTYLYVANGGYPGDQGDYQGHITAIDLATGSYRPFNTVCSTLVIHFYERPARPDCPQVQAAVWGRSGVVFDDQTDRIYIATGNGDFSPANADWGDSVLALNPDATGSHGGPLDSYTPPNYQTLQDQDLDLGSTAPAILPVPAASAIQHLALQSGKDGKLRLINLDNMSGQGGPGHVGGAIGNPISLAQGDEVLTAPAVWQQPGAGATWIFVANDNGIAGYQLLLDARDMPYLSLVWQNGNGGTSPLVSNGVLYYAGPGVIRALDPLTGNQHWSAAIGGVHWQSPIVDNGTLYVTDNSKLLHAYRVPGT